MITLENFKDFLISSAFENNGDIYSKYFEQFETVLKVDFSNKEIIYPEDKGLRINERQTCNFSSNENFVVFECVHRLIQKGYKPDHIELEPKWKVGHGASGGRADILVKDQKNNPLLIIECKTYGREFDKAWKETNIDGGQLFSYAQQIPDTGFLCLYASDWGSGETRYTSHIISHKDNEEILKIDQNAKSFRQASDVKTRFEVWKETYKSDFTTKGVFEPNIQPYNIGKNKYTIDDLSPVDARNKEGKYHEFRTILRKYNVSGREKAFDVLVNLFLCKIVDESNNIDDLKFYWKNFAYDTYYDLIDRLQELYKIGMGKFLNQEIVYVSNAQIDNAFWTVKTDRNATKEQIQKYFRELKYYTNNDFGFIDVHNEHLFNQNAQVLLDVVKMWQDLRIKTDEQNQFLGDMFEFFLDNGVKQSEGQFFTPLPVCKFILMSLPLEELIKDNAEPLHTIDYACGAGHFLTEYASQITPFLKKTEVADYCQSIKGIEKEYRLSKVAKLSSFMYGYEGVEISHHDALGTHDNIKENFFNILVANPPFAVEGFLETLSETDRGNFELTKTVSDIANNRNIQCFFIERAKQLLAPGGLAGIIIPSSVLSNSDGTHIATREILLKYFDIIALVELGNGTFGKTGTNTVALFIRRKAQRPEPADHYSGRIDDWFSGLYSGDNKTEVYQDSSFIIKYCALTQIPFEHYKTLLDGSPSEELLNVDIFKEYRAAFDTLPETKKLRSRTVSKSFTALQRDEELGRRLTEYIRKIEKNKLYYFVLACTNPRKVIIVKSPSGNNEQKQFLGYEWSAAKGSEGIRYNGGNTVDEIITPLFDPKNRYNPDKINFHIQQNFIGKETENSNNHIVKAKLVDILDFSRKDFNKAFSLNPKVNNAVESKWDLVKLGDLVETLNGLWTGKKPPFIKAAVIRNTNFIAGGKLDLSDVAILNIEANQYVKRKLQYGDIVIEKSGGSETQAIGRVIFFDRTDGEFSYSNFTSRLRITSDKIEAKYLHIYLNYFYETGNIFDFQSGISGIKNLNFQHYLSIKIPLPPISVQQEIVKACEAIDEEYKNAVDTIERIKKSIEENINEVLNSGTTEKIGFLCSVSSGGTPSRNISEYWTNGTIPWLKSEVCKEDYVYKANEFITEDGLKKSNAKYFERGTTLMALVGATKGKTASLSFKATTNQNIAGIFSLDETKILNKFIFYVCRAKYNDLIKDLSSYAMLNLTHIRNIKIPLPPLAEQTRIVSEIEILETEITKSQKIINETARRKQEVIGEWL